jgi:hypothetical protein
MEYGPHLPFRELCACCAFQKIQCFKWVACRETLRRLFHFACLRFKAIGLLAPT